MAREEKKDGGLVEGDGHLSRKIHQKRVRSLGHDIREQSSPEEALNRKGLEELR
jgi:hypothetical protein